MHMRHGRMLAAEKESATDKVGTLRRLLNYFSPYAGLLAIVGVLLVLNSFIEVVGPYMMGVSVDQFIVPKDSPRPAWLTWLVAPAAGAPDIGQAAGLARVMILLIVLYLIRWFSMSGQSYLMNVMGQKFLFKLRTEILERIHTLSL
jgi:ATP-binding cassette subfamily B multidrug efflux pump